ncbi:thioredoxin family protein, partial [Aquimarina sp. AD10]
MKSIYLIFCFISLLGFSQEKTDSGFWATDFEKAITISKKEKRPIVLYFTGSDWCKPCMLLKEDFFENEKLDAYKSSFVFLKIDIPRNADLLTENQKTENYKLLDSYNPGKVFPLVNILN